MRNCTQEEVIQWINTSENIVFLTGAGISTAAGIPDYRSLKGVYQGYDQPEYLLSDTAMQREPEKFYSFVKQLYHPKAQPTLTHRKIASLERSKQIAVISQNIDGLHALAGSEKLVDFHGTLYNCYCRSCGKAVAWQAYLLSSLHEACGGQVRPAIVLYGEGFTNDVITQAISFIEQAELIVVAGTSFQVYPFAGLLAYRSPESKSVAINATPIEHPAIDYFVQSHTDTVFAQVKD